MKIRKKSNENRKENSYISFFWGNLPEDVQEKCSIPTLSPTSLFYIKRYDSMENMKIASYTSVWDGCVHVTSLCVINTSTHEVVDIQVSDFDAENLIHLDCEYVVFDNKKHSIYRQSIHGTEKIFYQE